MATGAQPGSREWASETECYIRVHFALPKGVTTEQVNAVLAEARAVHPATPTDQEGQIAYLGTLRLWGLSVLLLGLNSGAEEKQAFVSAAEELLATLAPDSWVWSSIDILFICGDYGELLGLLGRCDEAVSLGRRFKPILEAALEREAPKTDTHLQRKSIVFYKQYTSWLLRAAREGRRKAVLEGPKEGARTQLMSSEEQRAEADEVMSKVIPAAEALPVPPSLLGSLFISHSGVLVARNASDKALRLLQRGLKMPLVRASSFGSLVAEAIHCLCNLRRDEQATALIEEALAEARRNPKALSSMQLATVHHFQAIVLCRRGKLVQARRAATAAIGWWSRMVEGRPRRHDPARLPDDTAVRWRDTTRVLLAEILERLGKREELDKLEEMLGGIAVLRPSCAVRWAGLQVEEGSEAKALETLRQYYQSFAADCLAWYMRSEWWGADGGATKPLEMLVGLLEEGSEERVQVQELIESTAREDQVLRRQALEELQSEMRQGRQQEAAQANGGGGGASASKASRKKRKKREKKQQQQQQQRRSSQGEGQEAAAGSEGAVEVEGAMSRLSLENGQAAAPAQEGEMKDEDDDECAICLWPFDCDEERGQEEVLGCGHRYHDVCMDRWLCKCNAKELLATCPACRGEVVRGGAGEG